MSFYRQVSLALLAGAVAGALVLGIAGRAATAGVAFVTGNALNLSLRGVLEGANTNHTAYSWLMRSLQKQKNGCQPWSKPMMVFYWQRRT